jgi:hypothetical protein
VAEQPVPLSSPITNVLVLRLLIAPRDAARVALGRLHVLAAPVEPALRGSLSLGALLRTALPFVAVRGHRSSIVEGDLHAYHVTTE